MGTFLGHLFPGSMFMLLGLWWTTNILKKYLRMRQSRAGSYTNTCFYVLKNRIPVEEYMYLVIGFGFIPGEYFANSFHYYVKNYYHVSMYLTFGLTGIASLMERKGWFAPPGSSYVCSGWAHAIIGFLMHFHAHSNTPVIEQLMHNISTLLIGAVALSYFVEMALPNQVLAGLGRAYLSLLYGIWFSHGAYQLYPNPWTREIINATDHQVMMLPVVFAFDCFLAFGIVVISGLVQYRCIRGEKLHVDCQKISTRNLHIDSSTWSKTIPRCVQEVVHSSNQTSQKDAW